MRNPYKILGVSREAGPRDLKDAYRRRARLFHPDLHPGDPKAAEKFRELAAAFELLSDREKRQAYDSGHIDARGRERKVWPTVRAWVMLGPGAVLRLVRFEPLVVLVFVVLAVGLSGYTYYLNTAGEVRTIRVKGKAALDSPEGETRFYVDGEGEGRILLQEVKGPFLFNSQEQYDVLKTGEKYRVRTMTNYHRPVIVEILAGPCGPGGCDAP